MLVRALAKAAPGSQQNTGTASAPAQAKPAIHAGTAGTPIEYHAWNAEMMQEPQGNRNLDPILGLSTGRA